MPKPDNCPHGGPTKKNGNCMVPAEDGLPVQCVGPWAKDKHDYLRRYIEATKGPRSSCPEIGSRGKDATGGDAQLSTGAAAD